jgi:PAS domain S-box-containing protein
LIGYGAAAWSRTLPVEDRQPGVWGGFMLVGSYNGGLVALSVVVATAAAYVALDLAARVAQTTGRSRALWLLGGAASMGTGIWSMHYLGMLAFSLPVPVLYDVPTVAASLVAATVAAGVALFAVSRGVLGLLARLGGSVAMGVAVATMHYVGMAAMRLPAMHHYDVAIVLLSIAIAVLVSYVALWLAFHFRTEDRALAPLKLLAAAVMGVAVAGMHYTGMAAVTFMPESVAADTDYAVSVSALGTFGVATVTFMVLALAILSSRLDRRLSEQARAVQASELRYQLLFHRSLAGVYQSTLDGELLDCNDALARILGYGSRAELMQRRANDLYSAPEQRLEWVRRLQADKTLANFECQLETKDGEPIWVLESATLVETPDRPAVVEGTIIDITWRKQAEEQVAEMTATLLANVERYRLLVESTSAVPWEMDGETLLLRYISPQAATLFGLDVQPGDPDGWSVVHPDDVERVRAQFATLAAAPSPSGLDIGYRIVTGDKSIAHVRSIVAAHTEEAGVILRGITLDVTQQRLLEMELQQAQKLESVGRLAAGVAHEINTPVQFVNDSVHFVRTGMQDLQPFLAASRALMTVDPASLASAQSAAAEAEREADLEYLLEHMPKALDRSLEGLERVATIVRSMKEFAHPDQSHMSAVDINRAIQSTLTVASNEYKYVADVVLDLQPLPVVTCHGGEVNQAVLNIIVNAAHAIEDRSKSTGVRGRISVSTRHEDDTVVIDIADTGGGIPETVQSRIFDPFFTTKAVGRGTGQGLAIARSVIVDKHGGELTFDTKPGVGTTFHLRLPVAGRSSEVAA